jgi:hypothetical protein
MDLAKGLHQYQAKDREGQGGRDQIQMIVVCRRSVAVNERVWSEVDSGKAVWTIAEERIKVPLTSMCR